MMKVLKPLVTVNEALARIISAFITGILGCIIHFYALHILGRIVLKVVLSFSSQVVTIAPERLEKLQQLANSNIGQFFKTPEVVSFIVATALVLFVIPLAGTVQARHIYTEAKEKKISKKGKFGSAKWATDRDIAKAELTGPGVVLGRSGRQLVEKPPVMQGHVLIVGGTGSGKSRGSAIPTLLRWPGAALVIDVKRELWQYTSGSRPGKVYAFDPEIEGSDPYDPLLEARTVEGAQEFARYLIPEPPGIKDPFWLKAAQGILAAAAMEGANRRETLTEVAEKLCTISAQVLVNELLNSSTREVRLLAAVAGDIPEKTLAGVIAEMRSNLLTLAADPGVARATTGSAWTPATLEAGATIYLRVSEKQLQHYRSLWTLIISQVLRYLSSRPEGSQPPILLLLDELPRLGKMPGLLEALATLRSRNVHIVSIIQSMAQLDTIYGRDERKVIADVCGFKLVLSATDPETQRYFADLAGQKTVYSSGYSSGRIMPNYSANETGVPLLRPEEWARLEKPVLFTPNLQPAQVEKAYWDLDPILQKLAKTHQANLNRPNLIKKPS